ncbi:mid region of cactin-domain-containing protein [Suillus cothurnatus]|nr:mid region of cactin-domain-containing protein [Suillus cothurnatus]
MVHHRSRSYDRERDHSHRSPSHRELERDRDHAKDKRSSKRDPPDEYKKRRRSRRERSNSRGKDEERKDKKRKRDKSEERRARKVEKLRIKEEEEARQVAELSVYSATDNPFHDVNLGQQFRWHKKNEKDRKQGLSLAEAQRKDAIRRQDAKEELERLNRRRAEREAEQRLREEEESRMARMAESAQMSEWIAKDGEFQLEQERSRAAIRIREKRAKAIDFLALNLKYAHPLDEDHVEDDAGLEIDLDEPYNILDNLSPDQIDELHDDIERYLSLETSEVDIDFWTNMMVVCKDRIDRIKASECMGVEAAVAVESEITALLSGKSYDHLATLQKQIQTKLASGEPIDTDYWEGLLKRLLVWKAKAKLKSLHEVVVRNRLEQLRKRQRDEALHAQEELLAGVARSAAQGLKDENYVAPVTTAEADMHEDMEPYDRSMSPPLIDIRKLTEDEREIDIVTELDDLRALLKQRRTVAASRFVPKAAQPMVEVEAPEIASGADLASEALYRAEAERELDEEEELFNLEENIANPTSYNWEDKYRPRKPRYFNRVHTGYEWNKYNQTHYDVDNPPPKVVQGYKFNIFYPDLIDKSKAPTYKIVREPGNEDTVLLHFSAGPPYEDIGFRIVNREWEFSHKRGFRSSFDRGCLSLWFNFRRNCSFTATVLPKVDDLKLVVAYVSSLQFPQCNVVCLCSSIDSEFATQLVLGGQVSKKTFETNSPFVNLGHTYNNKQPFSRKL